MANSPRSSEQERQEAEYAFPYHYIPELGQRGLTLARHWPWGFRYLGGIEVVLDQLAKAPFSSMIDVGCGDGRFLPEVKRRFPDAKLLGIDYSERAIRLAQALHPEIEYRTVDLFEQNVGGLFDVATLVEVIEHIPPARLPEFVRAVAACVKDGGRAIVTVPHANKPLAKKHFQHFTSDSLRAVLAPHFRTIEMIPFDVRARTPMAWLVERVLGAKGDFFLLTNRRLLGTLFDVYRTRLLYAPNEASCLRLAAVCAK